MKYLKIPLLILLSHAHVGGQAVLEGVMMRAKGYWAIAVRTPDGSIAVKNEPLNTLSVRYPVLNKFFLRGTIGLIETMVLGYHALAYSANQSTEEEVEIGGKEMAISFTIAMVLAIGLFLVIPYYIVSLLQGLKGNNALFTLIEGSVKIGMFIGYVALISQMNDVRRMFQYHGAEHKSINALENEDALTVEACQKYDTVHVRCGTTFILIVLTLSIFVFTFLPTNNIVERIAGKLMLFPVIAGISYELIRVAGKNKNAAFTKIITFPGLLMQRLTTKEPTNDMVEVALVALNKALDGEKMLKNEASSKISEGTDVRQT